MSFVLNNIKYFYIKYLTSGWNSTVHLIKDDIITESPKYNGPYTNIDSLLNEIKILKYINNHSKKNNNIVQYFDSGPEQMRNSNYNWRIYKRYQSR